MKEINLRPEFSPKKVLILMQTINYGMNKYAILKKCVSPEMFGTSSLDTLIRDCINLGLIEMVGSEKKFKLLIELKYIENEESFSYFMGNRLMKDSAFLSVTQKLMSIGKPVVVGSIEELTKILRDDYSNIKLEYLRAYRLWFDFIGLGKYTNNNFLIFPYKRLNLIISYKETFKNDVYNGLEFLSQLIDQHPEFETLIEKRSVDLTLSEVLRLLVKKKMIELKYTPDTGTSIQLIKGNSVEHYSEIHVIK